MDGRLLHQPELGASSALQEERDQRDAESCHDNRPQKAQAKRLEPHGSERPENRVQPDPCKPEKNP